MEKYNLKSIRVWRYDSPSGWHLITLPVVVANQIEERFSHLKKEFGIIKVSARLAQVSWQTSIFKDTKSSSFVMPIKSNVMKKTGIKEGDLVDVELAIND